MKTITDEMFEKAEYNTIRASDELFERYRS